MYFLAIRQMASRKKQTLLILLGISLGTMMYVVISGMQLGMREYFVNRLLSNSPHIRITAPDEPITERSIHKQFFDNQIVNWISPPGGKRDESHISYPQGWFDRFRADPEVVAYSPGLSVNVIVGKGKLQHAASLNGIVPSRFRRVSKLEDSMKSGSLMDLAGGGNRLIVGVGVLEEIGARIGDTVLITVGAGIGEPRPFKIVATFELGNEQLDHSLLYANLSDVQQVNKRPGRIGEIWVNLVDMDSAHEVADRWKLGTRDKVESWQETFANLFQMFYVQDITRWTISVAILIVAGFGVYNVLSIMITQKQREIAILRSIGYPPRKILNLFLIQGWILGVSGALVGLALGYLANLAIGSIDFGSGLKKGMGITHLIISQDPRNYLIAFAMAVVSAIVASILPARHASKLTPLDIIRSS
jgi:lipoprotein-releasing system permease protein